MLPIIVVHCGSTDGRTVSDDEFLGYAIDDNFILRTIIFIGLLQRLLLLLGARLWLLGRDDDGAAKVAHIRLDVAILAVPHLNAQAAATTVIGWDGGSRGKGDEDAGNGEAERRHSVAE